jgi:membrane fusion protein, multidrug efflux system
MLSKFVIVLMMVVTFLTGCNNHEHEKEEALLKLSVTKPLRKDTSIIKEYVSQIHAFKHIELRALERGYLQDTFVDEGQTVQKGQKMFKIMPNFYEVDLLKAKAEADLVRIEYQNTKALADKNIVSKTELALAEAKLNKAQAEVKLAQTHLNFTNINAPFTGIMDHFHVRNGSLLDEGELLTTLSDISKVWVYFNVPESEYLDYKTKRIDATPIKVKLKMANGEIFNQDGVIETVEADFDNKTGNIEFRAVFPNPDQILRHGETGNIQIDIPYKDALIIPQKATFEILDKTYVYLVNKEHKLEQRLIHIAAEQPYIFLIKDGLKEEDQVLIEGLRKVQNGQEIDVNFIPSEKVLSQLELHAE